MPTLTFDEERHFYALDGKPLPSVSKIIRMAGLAPDLSKIPPDVLEKARRRGIAVHTICEQMDRGEDPLVHPDLEPYADAYALFLRESGYRSEDTEQMVYHPDLLYAGRLDARGWLHDHRTIIDRKATAEIDHVATAPQLGGYTGAYLAHTPEEHIETVYALHLQRTGRYELHPYAYESAWSVFASALTIYRWQQRHHPRRKHEG